MDEKELEDINKFSASFKMINGKKTLVIKPHVKNIVHPDGRKDVVVTLPTLSTINKFNAGLKK